MDKEKSVDESWKEEAFSDKEVSNEEVKLQVSESLQSDSEPTVNDAEDQSSQAQMEVSFINYITSLGFQVLIFLGEIPNPMTNKQEKSIEQAKFLIDTLTMIRDKTKGNLDEQEDNLLNASIYELQLKYVEVTTDPPKE